MNLEFLNEIESDKLKKPENCEKLEEKDVDKIGRKIAQKKLLEDEIKELKEKIEKGRNDFDILPGDTGWIEWGNPYTSKRFNAELAIKKGYITEDELEKSKIEGRETRKMSFKFYDD